MKKRAFPLKHSSERGNALFLVLLTVLMVAGVIYFFTQDDDRNRPPNREVKSINSRSITQYADSIAKGVAKMQANNMPIDEIEFYAPTHPHFDEMLEEEAGKNLVFHHAGGGVHYSPVDRDAVEHIVKDSDKFQDRNWHFVQLKMPGIGTKKKDLVAILDNIKESLCERIDQRITGDEEVPEIDAASNELISGEKRIKGHHIMKGKMSFCIKATDHYLYYRILSEQ